MQTVKKKLSELHKTEKNIRKHSEKQITEYIRSLEMFGQIRPLVVTEDGEILVGNGMYEALQKMGKDECDVYVVEGLSNAQKKKLMLADNKVYELGITVVDSLDDILVDLGGDFDVPGYDPDLLGLLAANPFDVDEEVKSYGSEEPKVTQEVQDNSVQYASVQEASQYKPPVRLNDGSFASPDENIAETAKSAPEAPETPTERKYVICPHCGNKIWL